MRAITYWLSLGMIFVIPWENVVNIEGVGTIGRAVGLLLAVSWVTSVVATNEFRKPHAFHSVIFVYILWHAVSVFWSVDFDTTFSRYLSYFQIFAMVYILWDLYRTPAALNVAFQCYVLGAYVSIFSLLIQYFSGVEDHYVRYSATGFNSNALGLILTLGLPLAWYLATFEYHGKKTYWLRFVNYAYIPAASFAILLTASRAAVFATLPVVLFMLGSMPRLRPLWRASVIAVIIGILLALLPFVPQKSLNRIATTNTVITEGGLNNRLDVWWEGVVIISEHPLLGVGSGAFRAAATKTGKVAHNFAISLLAEVGIIGFALFCIIFAMAFYQLRYIPKPNRGLWLAILLAWLLFNLSHSFENSKVLWLFLGLLVTNAHLYSYRDEQGPTQRRTDHEGPARSVGELSAGSGT